MATKKTRGRNFVEEEMHYMLSLIEKYKNVIENKKTNSSNNEEKASAWKIITDKFNKNYPTNPRTTDQLFTKYDNLKQGARKYSAEKKRQQYGTGGGPAYVVCNPIFDYILEIINKKTVQGENNMYDDDFLTESSHVPAKTPENKQTLSSNNDFSKQKIDVARIIEEANSILIEETNLNRSVNEISTIEIIPESFTDSEIILVTNEEIPVPEIVTKPTALKRKFPPKKKKYVQKRTEEDTFLNLKNEYYKMKIKTMELDCKLKQQELEERNEQAPFKLALLKLQIEYQQLVNAEKKLHQT